MRVFFFRRRFDALVLKWRRFQRRFWSQSVGVVCGRIGSRPHLPVEKACCVFFLLPCVAHTRFDSCPLPSSVPLVRAQGIACGFRIFDTRVCWFRASCVRLLFTCVQMSRNFCLLGCGEHGRLRLTAPRATPALLRPPSLSLSSSRSLPGTEEGYASNPSRGVDQDGRPLEHEEGEEDLVDEEEEEDEEDEVDDDGGRHHGAVGNGVRGGGGGGGGHGYNNSGEQRTSRDQADLERRAMAHAYTEGLDRAEATGYLPPGGGGGGDGGLYGSGGDRYQQRSMPPAPPAGAAAANGISPVDARAAASLAMRTRLAQGGVAVPERPGQRPEPGPVLAPGQAAAAAAAALRRGPTPGSHSLPSMVLVPLEALKAHRRVPRSSDRRWVFWQHGERGVRCWSDCDLFGYNFTKEYCIHMQVECLLVYCGLRVPRKILLRLSCWCRRLPSFSFLPLVLAVFLERIRLLSVCLVVCFCFARVV